MEKANTSGFRHPQFRHHFIENLKTVHSSLPISVQDEAQEIDGGKQELSSVFILRSAWIQFQLKLAEYMNKLFVPENVPLPPLSGYSSKAQNPSRLILEYHNERTLWQRFPRNSPNYTTALCNFAEIAKSCPDTAVRLVVQFFPRLSNTYQKVLALSEKRSTEEYEKVVSNDSLDAVMYKIPGFSHGDMRQWDLLENAVNISIVDALTAILSRQENVVDLVPQTVNILCSHAFEMVVPQQAKLLQVGLFSSMRNHIVNQWGLVLGCLSTYFLREVVDYFWGLVECEGQRPQADALLSYINALMLLQRPSDLEQGVGAIRCTLERALTAVESKSITKHLKVTEVRSKTNVLRAMIRMIGAFVECAFHDFALPSLSTQAKTQLLPLLEDVFARAAEWSKTDTFKGDAFRIMATLLSRSPQKFYSDHITNFLNKRVLKSVWSDKKRGHCLEAINRLLQGSYVNGFSSKPVWLLPAAPEPSAYSFSARPEDTDVDRHSRVEMLSRELFFKKKPLSKLYRSIETASEVVLQLAAHNAQYVLTQLLPHLLSDLSFPEHCLIAMRVQRAVMDPEASFVASVSAAPWYTAAARVGDLKRLVQSLITRCGAEMLHFAQHCEKHAGWEVVGKSQEPLSVASLYSSFNGEKDQEDEDDEDEEATEEYGMKLVSPDATPQATKGKTPKMKKMKTEQIVLASMYRECVLLLPLLRTRDLLERTNGIRRDFFLGKLLVHRHQPLATAVSATLQRCVRDIPEYRECIVEATLDLVLEPAYSDSTSQLTLLSHLAAFLNVWSNAIATKSTHEPSDTLPKRDFFFRLDGVCLSLLARASCVLRSCALRCVVRARALERAFFFATATATEEDSLLEEVEAVVSEESQRQISILTDATASFGGKTTSLLDHLRLVDVLRFCGTDIADRAKLENAREKAQGSSQLLRSRLLRPAVDVLTAASSPKHEEIWPIYLGLLAQAFVALGYPSSIRLARDLLTKTLESLPPPPMKESQVSGKTQYTPEVLMDWRCVSTALCALAGGPAYLTPTPTPLPTYLHSYGKMQQCAVPPALTLHTPPSPHPILSHLELEKAGQLWEQHFGAQKTAPLEEVLALLKILEPSLRENRAKLYCVTVCEKLSSLKEGSIEAIVKATTISRPMYIALYQRLLFNDASTLYTPDVLLAMTDLPAVLSAFQKVMTLVFSGLLSEVTHVRHSAVLATAHTHWRGLTKMITSLPTWLNSIDASNPKTEAAMLAVKARATMLITAIFARVAEGPQFPVHAGSDLAVGAPSLECFIGYLDTVALTLAKLVVAGQGCTHQDIGLALEYARALRALAATLRIQPLYSVEGPIRKALIGGHVTCIWAEDSRTRHFQCLRSLSGIMKTELVLTEAEQKRLKKEKVDSAATESLVRATENVATEACSDLLSLGRATGDIEESTLDWLFALDALGAHSLHYVLSFNFESLLPSLLSRILTAPAGEEEVIFNALCEQLIEPAPRPAPSAAVVNVTTLKAQYYHCQASLSAQQEALHRIPPTSIESVQDQFGESGGTEDWADRVFAKALEKHFASLLLAFLFYCGHPKAHIRNDAFRVLVRLVPQYRCEDADDAQKTTELFRALTGLKRCFDTRVADIVYEKGVLVLKKISEATHTHALTLCLRVFEIWPLVQKKSHAHSVEPLWLYTILQAYAAYIDLSPASPIAPTILASLFDLCAELFTTDLPAVLKTLLRALAFGRVSPYTDTNTLTLDSLPNLEALLSHMLAMCRQGIQHLPALTCLFATLYRSFPNQVLAVLVSTLTDERAHFARMSPELSVHEDNRTALIVSLCHVFIALLAESEAPFIRYLHVLLTFCILHLPDLESRPSRQLVEGDPNSARDTMAKQLLLTLISALKGLTVDPAVLHISAALTDILSLQDFRLTWPESLGGAPTEAKIIPTNVHTHITPPVDSRALSQWFDNGLDSLTLFDHIVGSFGHSRTDLKISLQKECLEWACACSEYDVAINATVLLRHCISQEASLREYAKTARVVLPRLLARLAGVLNTLTNDWFSVRDMFIRLRLDRYDPFAASDVVRRAQKKMLKMFSTDQRLLLLSYALAVEIVETLKVILMHLRAADSLHLYPEILWSAIACLHTPQPLFPQLYQSALEIVATLLSPSYRYLFAGLTSEAQPLSPTTAVNTKQYNAEQFNSLAEKWNPPFAGLLPLLLQGLLHPSTHRLVFATFPSISSFLPLSLVAGSDDIFFVVLSYTLPWLHRSMASATVKLSQIRQLARDLLATAAQSRLKNSIDRELLSYIDQVAHGILKDPDLFVTRVGAILVKQHFPQYAPVFAKAFRQLLQNLHSKMYFSSIMRIVQIFLTQGGPPDEGMAIIFSDVLEVAHRSARASETVRPLLRFICDLSESRGDSTDLTPLSPEDLAALTKEAALADASFDVSHVVSTVYAVLLHSPSTLCATARQTLRHPLPPRQISKDMASFRGVSEEILQLKMQKRLLFACAPDRGPYVGGQKVTLTGFCLCDESEGIKDIASVHLCGVPVAKVLEASSSSVTVIPGAFPDDSFAGETTGDVVVTSKILGTSLLPSAYTYLRGEIYSVDPVAGPSCGGCTITVRGEGLIGGLTAAAGDSASDILAALTVTVCGHPVARILSATDDTVVVVTGACPPVAKGDVVLDSPWTGRTVAPAAFTVNPGGAALSLSPNSGPAVGGNVVTINALNIGNGEDVTAVMLCGAEALIVSQTKSQVIVRTGECVEPGPGLVEVHSVSFGTTSLENGYTYNARGVIQKVTPSAGPCAGGNTVTIQGIALGNGSDIHTVLLKGVLCTVLSQSETEVVVAAGNGSEKPGLGEVLIHSTSFGQTKLRNGYRYNSRGEIKTVTPSNGPYAGDVEVQIQGKNLGCGDDITTVLLGGEPATILAQSPHHVTVRTAPCRAHDPSTEVTVLSVSYGSSSLADGFVYNHPGVVVATQPAEGPCAGDFDITVVGQDLGHGDIHDVHICGHGCSILSQNRNEVVVHLPMISAPQPLTGDVVVSSLACGVCSLRNGFVLHPPGALARTLPSVGPCLGGTEVRIAGKAIGSGDDITEVLFGTIPATILAQDSDSVTVLTRPLADSPRALKQQRKAVPVPVRVCSATRGAAVLDAGFVFNPLGEIECVEPPSGPADGGNEVVLQGIMGDGSDVETVLFNGVEASIVSQSPGELIVIAGDGSHAQGLGDVKVYSPSYGLTVLADGYQYNPDGGSFIITPSSGPLQGGQTVVLKAGSPFGSGSDITRVLFRTVKAVVLSQAKTECVVQVPDGTAFGPGPVEVKVSSTAFGTTTTPGAYTYNPPGEITDISPSEGCASGGFTVTLSCTHVGEHVEEVTICGHACEIAEVKKTSDSTTLITVVAPSPCGHYGVGDVVVVSQAAGSCSALNAFQFHPPGEISSLSPSGGRMAGETNVVVRGHGLGSGEDIQRVTMCGLPATIVAQDEDSVTVRTAAASQPNKGSVIVQSATRGVSLAPASLVYEYYPFGTLRTVSPTEGPFCGGNTVEIIGEGLGSGSDISEVTLAGVAANIVKQSASAVTVIAGDGSQATGTGPVVVSSLSRGSATSSPGSAGTEYTYNPVPQILSVSPPNGPAEGGYKVMITGTQLGVGDVFSVTVGGVAAKVLHQERCKVRVQVGNGEHAVGWGDVVVESRGYGTARKASAFRYNTAQQQLEIDRQMEAERRALVALRENAVRFVNEKLGQDSHLAEQKLLPIDPHSPEQFFVNLSTGVLWLKLLFMAAPLIVDDETAVMKNPNPDQVALNMALLLKGLRLLDIDDHDLTPYQLMTAHTSQEYTHAIISIFLNLIEYALLSVITVKKIPEFNRLRVYHDLAGAPPPKQLTVEHLLLRWVNHILVKARSDRIVTNFTSDFVDSTVYTLILHVLEPAACHTRGLHEPNLSKRAAMVLDQMERIRLAYFLTPTDIVEGNECVCKWWVAYVCSKYSSLVITSDDTQTLDRALDTAPTPTEARLRLWLKSLALVKLEHNLVETMADAYTVFLVLDKLSSGLVPWTRVNNPFKKQLNRFKKQENWSLALSLTRSLRPRFPDNVTVDLLMDGAQASLFTLFTELREYDLETHIYRPHPDQSELLAWANQKVREAAKSSSIGHFKDPTLATGIFLADLLHALAPKAGFVNYLELTRGSSVSECTRNAKTVVRTAWKYGIRASLTVEDILSVDAKEITGFVYQLYTTIHRFAQRGGH